MHAEAQPGTAAIWEEHGAQGGAVIWAPALPATPSKATSSGRNLIFAVA